MQAGGVDLGLAAARAFSTEGVTSLRALTVPFLIETDAGAAAVARVGRGHRSDAGRAGTTLG